MTPDTASNLLIGISVVSLFAAGVLAEKARVSKNDDVVARLDAILDAIGRVKLEEERLMVDFAALAAQVAAIKDVELSTKTALDGLIQRFIDAQTSGDPAALAAAIADAQAASDALAASVATIPA